MKNIDFRNGRPLVMMVSQYDYGYNLQLALWSNGTPVTITAAEIVSENFTVACTFSGNVVTIPVTTSMTERFGHFPAELRVTDSTGQISSKNFDWFVERSPLAVKSTETYSGDIVEFTAKRVPLSSVVVTMEPIQDLNGYDAPWPAGGNKNLIPYPYSAEAQTIISSGTWNGMTIAENNGKISVKGTQNGAGRCLFGPLKLKANTTYTFSTNYQYANDSTKMNCNIYDYAKPKLYASPTTATPVTFTTTEECTVSIYLNPYTSNNGRSFDFTIQPQLEEGSSASEWTPYSNICPISGRTGASVVVAGKNLLPSSGMARTHNGITYSVNDDGTITASGTASGNSYSAFASVTLPKGEYVLSGCPSGGGSSKYRLYINGGVNDYGSGATFTLTEESTLSVAILVSNGQQVNLTFSPMIRLASIATDYVPYAGNTTYPITFTSAGTVYAGTVDLVSGVLTVTHGSITIDGSMSIRLEGTRFYVGKDDCKRLPLYTTDSIRCDRLPTVADETQIKFNSAGITAYKQSSSYVGRNWIYFSSGDESITTTAQMQSWLADNPLQVVYELVEPLTYTLTPTQVMSLLGENIVWSPDGEIEVVVPEYY